MTFIPFALLPPTPWTSSFSRAVSTTWYSKLSISTTVPTPILLALSPAPLIFELIGASSPLTLPYSSNQSKFCWISFFRNPIYILRSIITQPLSLPRLLSIPNNFFSKVIHCFSQTSYLALFSSLINHSNTLVSLSYKENRGHWSNCPQLPLSTMLLIQIYHIQTHFFFFFPSSGRRECVLSQLESQFIHLWSYNSSFLRDLAVASIPFLSRILNLSLPSSGPLSFCFPKFLFQPISHLYTLSGPSYLFYHFYYHV